MERTVPQRLRLIRQVLFLAPRLRSARAVLGSGLLLLAVGCDGTRNEPAAGPQQTEALTEQQRSEKIQERVARLKQLRAEQRREQRSAVEHPADRQPWKESELVTPGIVVPTPDEELLELTGRELLPESFPLEGGEALALFDGREVVLLREEYPEGGRRRWSYVLTGTQDDPVRHGPDWNFHSNGLPSIKRTWAAGQMEGLYEEYHSNGLRKALGSYIAGQMQGKWCRLTDLGRLRALENYRGGIKAGPYVEYHSNGLKAREGAYKGGRETGLIRSWHVNGFVEKETEYRRGMPFGVVREWYGTGQRKSEGRMLRQRVDGRWREWYRSGEPKLDETYDHDVLNGPSRQYNRKGLLTLDVNFSKGRLSGPAHWYSEKGDLLSEGEYSAGKAVGTHRGFHPGGELAWTIEYVLGEATGLASTFWPDGGKRTEGNLKDGQRDGEWRYYSRDGILDPVWSGAFEAGLRVGP